MNKYLKAVLDFLRIKISTRQEIDALPPMTLQNWIFKILGTAAYVFLVYTLIYGVFIKKEMIGIIGLVMMSCFHVAMFEMWYYKKFY